MKVLFLTLNSITTLKNNGIYTDLLREFTKNGHEIFCISPTERRYNTSTKLIHENFAKILIVKTLNIQKTNILEKAISTLTINFLFKKAINKYFSNIKFDLILYSTPPITFANTILYLKNKNTASKTYLLLKDIFPQNAIDLNYLKKKSLIYKYFRKKEIQLYNISDNIGCMSEANVKYLIDNNSYLDKTKVEVNPNSIDCFKIIENSNKEELRTKFNIPQNSTVFIYGGNLGKPQAIHFIKDVLDANKNRKDAYFIIVGSGTEKIILENWYNINKPENCMLLESIPQNDYVLLLKAADVGLIFLDFRFTIPNFPSRLLSYLENSLPIIAAVDNITDIGSIAMENNFGSTCLSNDLTEMNNLINKYIDNKSLINLQGKNGNTYLLENYNSKNSYNKIINHFNI